MSLEKTIQDPHDIIEKAPIGIYTATPQGRYTSANPALARMFGYESPEELIASITDIAMQVYVNPEERQEFMRMMQEHGKVVEHECRFKRKDGFKFWVSINARAVRDQNGNTLYYQGFTTDITERKLVEQDKEEIKERYRRMFMNAPVPYQSLDEQGFFLDVNETFLDILGYAREEVIGKNFGDFLHSDWVEQFKENFPRFKAVGEVLGVEFEMVKKDGSTMRVYLNGKIQRDEQGQFLRTDCIFHDISERKRAEDAMRKSESLFKKVFEILPIGLWIADNNGKLLRGNSAGAAIWGAQPNVDQREYGVFKARRLPSGEEISPDDWALAHTVNKGETIIDELLEIDAFDGKKRIILNYTAPVFNEEGNVEAAIVVNQDITDSKMAEEEREKLQSQLLQAQKMESIGILAGGIAHDFNNLLHAMGGNLELLDMKIPDDHPGKKRIHTIQKSMDRAAQLVKKLLLFTRKADIQTQVLDLNQEIHDASRLLERSIPRMISIELILDENARPINADPIQVEQVLLNLGTNAADAMPEGGRLIIETANVTLDQDFVRTHTGAKPGKFVLMTVTDTGCGMDKKTRDQVFDPFFTTKEVGKGTGLGLASVFGIVKAHGGYIICYSEPGQGTAFKIFWPAAEPGETEPDEKQAEQAVSQDGTETILVVDDDDQIRDLTSEVLDGSGYQVLSAESGEQALEIFRKKSRDIDLVLMDLNMPGMGGSQCTRKMMTLDPSVRVLVASGYSANVHGRNVLEFGAKDFIAKPFQVDQLLAKVRQVLDNQEKQEEKL